MLKDIVVKGDKIYQEKNKLVPINFQMHHILEMFKYFMPKMDLDGSIKLTIKFAEKPENEAIYNCDKYFRVSWYYVSPDNIQRNATGRDRDLFYVNLLRNILKDIAKINECDDSIIQMIDETVDKVIGQEFTLVYAVKKLTKTSKDRRYKATVLRNLSQNGEKWQLEICAKDGTVLCADLSRDYTHVFQESLYYKAEWQEGQFIISERLGRVMTIAIPDEGILQLYSFKGMRDVIALTGKQDS